MASPDCRLKARTRAPISIRAAVLGFLRGAFIFLGPRLPGAFMSLSDSRSTLDSFTRMDDQLFFEQLVFSGVDKSPRCNLGRFGGRPPIQSRSVSGLRYPLEDAGVAQLAEQLFCKQQVIGSIPFAGSKDVVQVRLLGDKTPAADSLQLLRYLRDTPRP